MKPETILLTILVAVGGHVYACKCNDPGSVKESFETTPVVLHGKVISIELVSFASTMKEQKAIGVRERLKKDGAKLIFFESAYISKISFAVIESFKGTTIRDTLTVYTTSEIRSCGYHFENGKEYIVYAGKKSFWYAFFITDSDREQDFEKDDTYWTNRCMRTKFYLTTEVDQLRLLKG